MSKHSYTVEIPIAGYAVVEVVAASEEEAQELAFADITREHIEEWDAYDKIVQGNVLRAPRNSVEITDNGEVEE